MINKQLKELAAAVSWLFSESCTICSGTTAVEQPFSVLRPVLYQLKGKVKTPGIVSLWEIWCVNRSCNTPLVLFLPSSGLSRFLGKNLLSRPSSWFLCLWILLCHCWLNHRTPSEQLCLPSIRKKILWFLFFIQFHKGRNVSRDGHPPFLWALPASVFHPHC